MNSLYKLLPKPNYQELGQSAISFGEPKYIMESLLDGILSEFNLNIEVNEIFPNSHPESSTNFIAFLSTRYCPRAFNSELKKKIDNTTKYARFVFVIVTALPFLEDGSLCETDLDFFNQINKTIILTCNYHLNNNQKLLIKLALTRPELIFSLSSKELGHFLNNFRWLEYFYN